MTAHAVRDRAPTRPDRAPPGARTRPRSVPASAIQAGPPPGQMFPHPSTRPIPYHHDRRNWKAIHPSRMPQGRRTDPRVFSSSSSGIARSVSCGLRCRLLSPVSTSFLSSSGSIGRVDRALLGFGGLGSAVPNRYPMETMAPTATDHPGAHPAWSKGVGRGG